MKSERRSAALILLLTLGMVGCGGGSKPNSSASAGPVGTSPVPPGGTPPMPTGGGPPASTLQAQLAACPNSIVISKDVPCLVGTYEGVTTDAGAACAFVYDNDGLAIYATGTHGILAPLRTAVFEKKSAANSAGFSITWAIGIDAATGIDLAFRSEKEPGSSNGLFIKPKNSNIPACLVTKGSSLAASGATSTANLLGRTWRTPGLLNGSGSVGVLTSGEAAFDAGVAEDGHAIVTFRQPDANGRMSVNVVEGRPAANGGNAVWSTPQVLDAEVPLFGDLRPRLAVSTRGDAVVSWMSQLPCEADAYEKEPAGKFCRYLYASRRLATDTEWERPMRIRASPPSVGEKYYARINARGDLALVFTSFVPTPSGSYNDAAMVALRQGDESKYRLVELQRFDSNPQIKSPLEQRLMLDLDDARSVFVVGNTPGIATTLVRARATTAAIAPGDFIRDPNNDSGSDFSGSVYQLQLSSGFAGYTWNGPRTKPANFSVYSPQLQQWVSGLNLFPYSLWGDTELVGSSDLLIYSGCRLTSYANGAFGQTRSLPPYCGRDRRGGVYAFNRNGDYVGINWAGQPGQWGYYSLSQDAYLKGAPGSGATVSDDFVLGTASDVFGAKPTQLLLTSRGLALAVTTNDFAALPSASNPLGARGAAQKLWAVYLQ